MSYETLEGLTTREKIRKILTDNWRLEGGRADLPISSLISRVKWTERFITTVSINSATGRTRMKCLSDKERSELLSKEVTNLYDAALDGQDHVFKLEEIFGDLIECEFKEQSDEQQATLVGIVWSFLQRMPACCPELPERLDNVPSCYFSSDVKSWTHLRVASLVHTNLIRLLLDYALQILHGGGGVCAGSSDLQTILNGVGELIDLISLGEFADSSRSNPAVWFCVRSYLWSFWQRANTFQHFAWVTRKLGTLDGVRQWRIGNLGYDYGYSRQFSPSPGVSLQQLSRKVSQTDTKAKNVCNWTLELLIGQHICYGLDFRLFHERYAAILGQEPGRCRSNSSEACDGKHFQNCLRFYGAKIENQTAHDVSCTYNSESEPRLPWDEASYRSVSGARAVHIDAETGSTIKYCAASDNTLTISHVWSHGQGGRPEEGINQCLHRRYCAIARRLDCDSYWIDTTCIPDEHKLRKEAISHINRTFSSSKAVLVCDKDLMKVDIRDLTLQLKESILVAVILSDWNTRAWTLLEGIRGRSALYILCKDNLTVNLADLLMDVVDKGRIDIVVFVWQVFHMLPSKPYNKLRVLMEEPDDEIGDMGSWLSNRPASRSGDDFVIWSLLIDPEKPPYSDAVEFWRAQVGRLVRTGYLVSSTKRLKKKGLSWAPESALVTSTIPTDPTSLVSHRANNARRSEYAMIT
ncbi:uncharacterized protein F4822DRAFT_15892 [Hypoxylon trugodes]|uniref:uncharacterized protein n=1 Tax=Hypoxylon trugodes TaxID=326681 RepID=UPI002192EBEF|nr:uncharacterized protein F4822DRAFT_15892 [Hypoxylon trugodes]KAI1393535.1 hypothetical protein F4822DRAFT_15892 [Hypoxylon trugodes]